MAEHEVMAHGTMYHRHYHDMDYGRRDCGDVLTGLAVDGIQKLLHETVENRSAIGDKINSAREQENANARASDNMMCGMERNLAEGQREINRDVVENKFAIKVAQCELEKEIIQNRFETAKSENSILKQMDTEFDLVKLQINNFERSVDRNFCQVNENIKDSERRIEKRIDRLEDKIESFEVARKDDLIAELRSKCARQEDNLFIGNKISELNALVNSVQQDQKFISKTVQFGTGNLAGTAQTANQG